MQIIKIYFKVKVGITRSIEIKIKRNIHYFASFRFNSFFPSYIHFIRITMSDYNSLEIFIRNKEFLRSDRRHTEAGNDKTTFL